MAGNSANRPPLSLLSDRGSASGAGGEVNAEIARAIVRIYRAVCGRGPTKARATFRGDVVVVVLEDVLTPSELSLIASGRAEVALSMRRELRAAMSGSMARAVATVTGSEVRAVMGDTHHDPNIAVEVFLLDRPVDPSRGPARMK